MKYRSATTTRFAGARRLPRPQRLAAGLILFFPLALCQPLWPQTAQPAGEPASPPPAGLPAAEVQPAPNTVRAAVTSAMPPALPPIPGAAPPPRGDASTAAPPPPPRAADRWWERWVSGLQLFGQKSYPFRWVEVSGSENARRAFRTSAPNTGNLTQVTVMGRLLNLLDVNMTLSDNQYGTDSRRMAARFHQGGADVSVGDVSASFAGNTLVPFQRLVRGVVVDNQFGAGTRVTGLLAMSNAPTRRVTVQGNNTVGPYYLNAFPIDVESVRVRIDETDVPRDDYTVDAYAGTITFKADRIVPQTSALRVSFSLRSTGTSAGAVYGGRAAHTFRGGHSLGLTVMGQATPSSSLGGGTAGRERIDDWTEGHADSVGPYQLRYGPVVSGSEQVFVGGVLQHAGTDYLLDADRGVIQFTRLILSSEPIRVIYRQVRDGQLQERIAGADSAGPYSLSEAPVLPDSESVIVVDARGLSLPQIRGRDYQLNATAGTITFLQGPLARGSVAVVLYRPRHASLAEPAGGVVGLDGTLRLGKAASVTAQLARSGGSTSASGSAMTLEGKVGLLPAKGTPRLRLGAALKSIDAGFSPIDTSGFLRNERGLSLDGDFAVNPYVRLYSRWEQGRRPLSYGATTTPDEIVSARQSVSGLTVQYPGWPSLTIQSTRLDQEGHTGTGSQANDSVRLQYDRHHFRASAEWARGATEGQSLVGTGTTGSTAGSATGPASTDTAKLSLAYSPSDRLTFSANGVTSQIRSLAADGSERETHARSVDLNATYRPARALQLSADYLLSDSGTPLTGLASTTTPSLPVTRDLSGLGGTPTGLGGYGTGMSSYGTGLIGSSAYAGSQRTSRLGISYTPGSRLSLNASLDASDTELYGTSLGHALGFSFLPTKRLTLTGTLSRQAARYAGIDGAPLAGSGMSSDLTYLSLRAGPFGKLLFNLDYQGLSTRNLSGAQALGSSPVDLANDVRTWTGRLSHPVGSHTAFLQYQSAVYGGANLSARKASAIAGIDLRLGRVLGLTLDMELHRYHDDRRPVDSYRARILSGNLSARF
jgi:hypothetical protein